MEEQKERQQQRKVKEDAAVKGRALKVQQLQAKKQQQKQPKGKAMEREGKEDAETEQLDDVPAVSQGERQNGKEKAKRWEEESARQGRQY